jgi:hypothetical protein
MMNGRIGCRRGGSLVLALAAIASDAAAQRWAPAWQEPAAGGLGLDEQAFSIGAFDFGAGLELHVGGSFDLAGLRPARNLALERGPASRCGRR